MWYYCASSGGLFTAGLTEEDFFTSCGSSCCSACHILLLNHKGHFKFICFFVLSTPVYGIHFGNHLVQFILYGQQSRGSILKIIDTVKVQRTLSDHTQMVL